MSVFSVRLNPSNLGSGYVTDTSATAGVSAQRSMDVTGPRGSRRLLADGETFTDCNYWLRYAPLSEGGTMAEDLAFIHVVTDDGSVWDDRNPTNNTFNVVEDMLIDAGSTYSDTANIINILSDHGGYAVALRLVVAGDEVNVRLNGSSSAVMSLATGTHTFNRGDYTLSSLEFDNSESSASNATVQVTMTILTTPTS